MRTFTDYFDQSFGHLREKESIDLKSLLRDEMSLISGDFYGIQKFIFDRLSTKNASKVIRAKSAFVQLFTITLARYICKKLDINERHIITTNAGKFEIVSERVDGAMIDSIQSVVNDYFLKYFFGLSGVSVTLTHCTREDFTDNKKYKTLRENIARNVETKKFQKFNLINRSAVLNYEAPSSNDTLCKICNIRKVDNDKCPICTMFITLGQYLVSSKISVSSKNDLLIDLEGFDTEIFLDEKIKSYIRTGEHNEPIDFTELAKNSCQNLNTGIKALGILKADVDGMGNFIKSSDITDSFENFDLFSKSLDNFFSLHIPNIMRENFPNTYTVFAGGDDLFLVGSWDVILDLARFIHNEFDRFVLSKKLSISFGIVIAKPSTPISYLADYSEHALEEAKGIDEGKNAITLFNETVKWKSYLSTIVKLDAMLNKIHEDDIKTAFLYTLLEFCEMSKKVNYEHDIPSTIWKSKLRYNFTRNMESKYFEILNTLDECIDHYPKETKMFLSEFIYKRRD